MVVFPNAKINIGLRITGRRPDGYHNIESIMVPIGWTDILEIVPSPDGTERLFTSGCCLADCPPEKNLVIKAFRTIERHTEKALPPYHIYLHKNIPDGAGLGGGSSDASATIRLVNDMARLGLTDTQMADIARTVGADCPFFIYNKPMLAQGVGEILTPVDIAGLDGKWIVVAKPHTESVSTRQAYAMVQPTPLSPEASLAESIVAPIEDWQYDGLLTNDFEPGISTLRPQIAAVRRVLEGSGAIFASMSGSGAAVFGIFDSAKMADNAASRLADCDIYVGELTPAER